MKEINYLEINRESWNKKVGIHVDSEFYNMEQFLQGVSSLKEIELNLLGDLRGKSVLHLQCHFGQDSISLAQLGAQVTAVDFSDQAIAYGVQLATKMGENVRFVCCDVYALPEHLDEQFDVVFASYGTIGWLPDLNKWATIVSRYLKPGGQFVFVEFHPVVWMFDDDFTKIAYAYSDVNPIVETYTGTYANKDAELVQEYVMWNHGLGDVMESLLKNGLQLIDLKEYDYSPYPCFKHVVEFEWGKYRIEHLGNKIPMVYSLKASK